MNNIEDQITENIRWSLHNQAGEFLECANARLLQDELAKLFYKWYAINDKLKQEIAMTYLQSPGSQA